MEVVKQFAVSMVNKPGVLANICRAMADAKVNIIAMTILASVEMGVLRMVLNKPDKARPILKCLDLSLTESEVIMVEMHNRPGALASVMERLSRAHVNIDYAYSTMGTLGGQATAVIKVQYPQKALKILKEAMRQKEGRVPIRAGYKR